MIEEPYSATFGEVEAFLAAMHGIASDKRTQFQARLRNYQKHGIPFRDRGGPAGKGRVVRYSSGDLLQLALTIEFARLGLLPERIAAIYENNLDLISQAVRLAVGNQLSDEHREYPTFIIFDPDTWDGLAEDRGEQEDHASATFRFIGKADLLEVIGSWEASSGEVRRSLINLSAVIFQLVDGLEPEERSKFLKEVLEWSEWLDRCWLLNVYYDEPEGYVAKARARGLSDEQAAKFLEDAREMQTMPRAQFSHYAARVARARDGDGK